jgi:hypothetical protein
MHATRADCVQLALGSLSNVKLSLTTAATFALVEARVTIVQFVGHRVKKFSQKEKTSSTGEDLTVKSATILVILVPSDSAVLIEQ